MLKRHTIEAPSSSERSDGKSRRRKSWHFKLLLLLTAFGLAVLAAEATLWVVAPVSFHEWMIWIPDGHIKGRAMPNQVFYTGEGFPVRINHLGFRGPDYTWEPPPETLRLAVFGGSAAFCYHARGEENTWPGRLQTLLTDALDMPVEVVNLALPGFDSSNSKVNYQFLGRALHPHVALIYHTWNDMKYFRPLAKSPQPFARTSANKPLWERIARATQIGRRARNFLHQNRLLHIENYYTSLDEEGATAAQPVVPKSFDWAKKNFEDFTYLTRSDDVLPVLISQATIIHPDNFDRPEYRLLFAQNVVGMTAPVIHDTWVKMCEIIKQTAEKMDAVYVNGYNAVPHDLDHLTDHVHLTDRGTDALARAIAETLLSDPRFLAVVERVRNENRRETPGGS